MERCFICNEPVLGLLGEDDGLDTHFLSSDDLDIIETDFFGECHGSCLVESAYAERWADLRIDSLVQVRGGRLTATDSARVVFNRLGISVVIEIVSSHRIVSIDKLNVLPELKPNGELVCEHEVNWGPESLFEKIMARIGPVQVHDVIALSKIIDGLGIADRYSPNVRLEGVFIVTDETMESLNAAYLSGVCRYPLALPDDLSYIVIDKFFGPSAKSITDF